MGIVLSSYCMMFMGCFVTCLFTDFGMDLDSILHPFGIHCHPFRVLFPNLLAPVPKRVLLEVHFSCWYMFGFVLVPFWLPVGSPLASRWLPLAPVAFLFPPFCGLSWNCYEFVYHVLRCLLRHVATNSAVAGPRLCRATT